MDPIQVVQLTPDAFSAGLLTSHGELFERAASHRFMREMAAGTLPEDAFRRYLVFEHAFVTTAVRMNGYALAKAPTLQARRRIATSVSELVTTQEAWFEGAFDRSGFGRDERRSISFPASVTALQDFVLRVAATGAFEEILATVLAAETLYSTWCTRAADAMPKDERFATWIALHADEAFVGHVEWVGRWLDAQAPDVGARGRAEIEGAFVRTLELELGFHDAAFGE